jgi:mono/diheme cytochrome c family protein
VHLASCSRGLGGLVLVFVTCACLAQQPAAIFADQCGGCHTIGGGGAAGPDLKGVAERHPRSWLIKFIRDPQALIAAKDPEAVAAQKQFPGMDMPGFPDLTETQIAALVDYIAQPPGGAAPASAPAAEVPFAATPEAIAAGRRLFMGEQRLVNGGASCVSCHTAAGVGQLGGGRLGPDLSLSFDKLGKAKGLASWLSATPTPVMAAAFKKNPLTRDEVFALTAFFQDAGASSQPQTQARPTFLALAAGLTVIAFVAIGGTRRNRLRRVRENLLRKRGGE